MLAAVTNKYQSLKKTKTLEAATGTKFPTKTKVTGQGNNLFSSLELDFTSF